MQITRIADHIIKGLLLLSIAVFAVALALYGTTLLGVTIPISDRLMPNSLLATLIAPLTVLTIYELVRLAVALQATLVQFIRTLFQVVSVIILSDLLKEFGKFPLRNLPLDRLADPGMLLVASFALYGLIELLERIEDGYMHNKQPKITPKLMPYRKTFAWIMLVYVAGFSAVTGVGMLLGWHNVGFGDEFLRLIFSGFVVVNVFTLLIALFFVKTYETLFEFFSLVLASVMVLFALPLATIPKLALIFAALVYSIATLSLHGFARASKTTAH